MQLYGAQTAAHHTGNLNVMDTQTRTSVHCLRELGHVTSVMAASADAAITVLACVDIVSPQLDVHSDVLVIKSEQGEDWRTFYLELPHTKVGLDSIVYGSRPVGLDSIVYGSRTVGMSVAKGSITVVKHCRRWLI